MIERFIQRHRKPVVLSLLGLFLLLYALLSLVNYCNYRTYCLDHGLYTHALFDYARLQFSDTTMFLPESYNLLSDHFDLYLILFSPLVWLLGPYTLLVVQVAAVLFGGWGIYRLISSYSESTLLPLAAMVSFLSFFGIWQALAFDYHSSVVAAMLVPWLLLFVRRRRFGWAALALLLVVVAKENMSLWTFFIMLALLWDCRKDRTACHWVGVFALFSALYFVLVSMVVMPALGEGGGFWRYAYMGANFSEVATYLLTHPFETVRLLFANITGDPAHDGLKLQCYLCLLLSCGALACLKPNYLVMLVPLLAQKMLAGDPLFWGVTYQYNVEFAPVLVSAAFIALSQFSARRWRAVLAAVALASTIATTIYTTRQEKSWVDPSRDRISLRQHYYQHDFDQHYLRQLVSQVPEEASLCASSYFIPHLALRDSLYLFPNGLRHHARYYLIKAHYWLNSGEEEAAADALIADTVHCRVLATNNDLYLIEYD